MSEVQRYYVGKYGLVEGESMGRLSVVLVADFDRVTAERDALQALLTAADERADVLEGLLRNASAWIKRNSCHGTDAIELWERIDAALKP